MEIEKKKKKHQSQPTKATTFEAKSEALAQTLFPSPPTSILSAEAEEFIPSTSYNITARNEIERHWDWPELIIDEIINAAPKKMTAPGHDCLDWTIIKAAMTTIPDFFFKAYKCLFESGQHPQQWKQAVGIIIPKRNKKDYSAPKAYRPISLLPCLSKLLERIYAK